MVALWSYLIQTGIFNQDDCNIPTWSRNLNNLDTIKDIFSTIKRREPNAYKNLILFTAIKSHCHSRHVGYNELGTQNTKSKSITSKIYICNDEKFFYSYITKQNKLLFGTSFFQRWDYEASFWHCSLATLTTQQQYTPSWDLIAFQINQILRHHLY